MKHPYRIIYNSVTGKIEQCRRISDAMLTAQLAIAPNLASIDSQVDNVNLYRINVETQAIESVTPPAVDYTQWMRERRSKLLTSSDWTQGVDSPLSDSKKAEWQTYRQALRDLPDSYTDGISNRDDVVWPTQPN